MNASMTSVAPWKSAPPAIHESVLVALLARTPAWLVAFIVVLVGARPEANLRYEPALLVATAVELAGACVYVAWIRRPARRRLGRSEADIGDIGALALMDLLFAAAVLLLSGGMNTPYYHFIVMSLLLPAFLFHWPGSLGVLAVFELSMVAIWTFTGGLDSWTRAEQLGGAVPGLLLTPLLVVVVAQYMARLTRSLHEAAAERARLVAEEERARMAGEIHDGVAQFLYILQMGLDQLAQSPADEARVRERLRDLTRLAKQALAEVRQYIFDLRPLLDESATLEETLRSQAREFRAVAEIPLTVTVEGREPPLSTLARGALFRVTQEALANVYRHAQASTIAVTVRGEPDRLTVEVSDDGAGMDTGEQPEIAGRGITNMRRRLAEVGGTLEIWGRAGAGTTVRASVPAAGSAP